MVPGPPHSGTVWGRSPHWGSEGWTCAAPRTIFVVLGLIAIGGAFAGGFAGGLAVPRNPATIEVDRIITVPVDVERVVTVEVERVVTREVERVVTQTVEVPVDRIVTMTPSPTPTPRATATPEPTPDDPTSCLESDSDYLVDLASRYTAFEIYVDLANTTPRLALASVVGDMAQQRIDLVSNKPVEGCIGAYTDLESWMAISIEAFQAFLAQRSDSAVQAYLRNAEAAKRLAATNINRAPRTHWQAGPCPGTNRASVRKPAHCTAHTV